MSASWLAQMGWEVYVVTGAPAGAFSVTGSGPALQPSPPAATEIAPTQLAQWLAEDAAGVAVIDLTTSANHVKEHIRGAWFAIRAQLALALTRIPQAPRYVVTCGNSVLARFAAPEVRELLAARGIQADVYVLSGGNTAWFAAGLPTEAGEQHLAVPRTDRYRRPYEGTDAPAAAMQAYLDWEFGLVAQLGRDGTHHFKVI
jgi:rhodanese-related sulfurtransferase